MALKLIGIDRVMEVANAPGTATVTLGGAVPGFDSFASTLSSSDCVPYFIEAVDSNGIATGQWERGYGFFSGNTIQRQYVIDGSSGKFTTVNFTSNVRMGIALMAENVSCWANPGGRLSLSTNSYVVDVAGNQNTINYVPYLHDRIMLWNGYGFQAIQFAVTALPLTSAVANTSYDVYAYISGTGPTATLGLEMLAWTNPNNRATAIVYTNGIVCKNGDPTRRYLGSFYCQTAGTTCDYGFSGANNSAPAKRYLWNMYNRVRRSLLVADSTATWTYGTGAWRIARGVAAPNNCVEMMRGLDHEAVFATASIAGSFNTSQGSCCGIGVNGAAPASPSAGTAAVWNTAGNICQLTNTAAYVGVPGTGYTFLSLQEYDIGTGQTKGSNYGLPALSAFTNC